MQAAQLPINPHVTIYSVVYWNERICLFFFFFFTFFRASKWNVIFSQHYLNFTFLHIKCSAITSHMDVPYYVLLLLRPLSSSHSLMILAYLSCHISSYWHYKKRWLTIFYDDLHSNNFHVSCVRGEMICYRNWWPAWYFKRLRCILLSDCFPQIYICLKGGCGCQQ